jgi:hypothetical protein
MTRSNITLLTPAILMTYSVAGAQAGQVSREDLHYRLSAFTLHVCLN